MLGFPENGPCLLRSGTVASWELVPLGEGRLLSRARQMGTLLPEQDQKRRRERHPGCCGSSTFPSPQNADSACEGAAGSLPLTRWQGQGLPKVRGRQ